VIHHERSETFQELFVDFVRRRDRRNEEFWAVQDVNFSVHEGEILGLVGQNGSARAPSSSSSPASSGPAPATSPPRGRSPRCWSWERASIRTSPDARTSFLNGSLLGLSRKQVAGKLDAIVAFSELEKFIDIPVKHYSSGMYMRLAFSIAINVDAEILLLDEILAVGDARFQRKCLDRVFEMKEAGKTILFVSHELSVVRPSATGRAHRSWAARCRGRSAAGDRHLPRTFGIGQQLAKQDHPFELERPDTRSSHHQSGATLRSARPQAGTCGGGRADRRRGARHLA